MRSDPLEKYIETAPSTAMREVARIARRRQFRQESLARAMSLTPAAVAKHFRTRSPHEATLEGYARALSVPPEYLKLIRDPPVQLTPSERQSWARRLDSQLHTCVRVNCLPANAFGKARPFLRRLVDRDPHGVLARVVVAACRARYVDPQLNSRPPTMNYGVETLLAAMVESGDLSPDALEPGAHDAYLQNLWVASVVGGPMRQEAGALLLDFARLLLRADGVDPATMDRFLIAYHQPDKIVSTIEHSRLKRRNVKRSAKLK